MVGIRKSLIVVGSLCLLYGLGVFAIIGITHWFDLFGIITGVGIIAFALLTPFFENFPKFIKQLFLLVLIVSFCTFLFTEILIVKEGQSPPQTNAEYVIILGAKVEGSGPSLALARRIEAAVEYMLENPESVAVGTGGRGVGEDITEGEAIENGLRALGIEASRIIIETESTSTKENLLYGLHAIEKSGGSAKSKVVIISSKYHVFRAKKLAQAIGYESMSTKGCRSMIYLLPHYYAREFAALVKEKMDGNI